MPMPTFTLPLQWQNPFKTGHEAILRFFSFFIFLVFKLTNLDKQICAKVHVLASSNPWSGPKPGKHKNRRFPEGFDGIPSLPSLFSWGRGDGSIVWRVG